MIKKYLLLFLTLILFLGCGSKSGNNGERKSDIAAEPEAASNNRIDSGRSQAGKTVELSREEIFDRRLRELYAGQPVSTKDSYLIINRGKSAQPTAIIISRPKPRH
jgi:hypothetical protein